MAPPPPAKAKEKVAAVSDPADPHLALPPQLGARKPQVLGTAGGVEG